MYNLGATHPPERTDWCGLRQQPVGKPEAIPLAAGDAVVFPSKRLMHQVAAVTRGQRKSLALFARTPSKIVRSDSDDDDNDDV